MTDRSVRFFARRRKKKEKGKERDENREKKRKKTKCKLGGKIHDILSFSRGCELFQFNTFKLH